LILFFQAAWLFLPKFATP